LLLSFKKEDSSFSEEKEAKRLLFYCVVLADTGLGRREACSGSLKRAAVSETKTVYPA
jgi:hypothetical protein